MPKKKPNIKVRSTVKPPRSLAIGVLRAALISLAVGILLLVCVCAIFLTTDDPGTYAPLAAALIPLPVSLLCGILSAKQSGAGGLLSGLLGGGVLCLCLFILGFLLPGEGMTAPLPITIRVGGCLGLAAIGGYSVTHKKVKIRRGLLQIENLRQSWVTK